MRELHIQIQILYVSFLSRLKENWKFINILLHSGCSIFKPQCEMKIVDFWSVETKGALLLLSCFTLEHKFYTDLIQLPEDFSSSNGVKIRNFSYALILATLIFEGVKSRG